MLVDHAVVERAGIVIVGLATLDDRSAQALTQFALGFVTHDVLLILWGSCWRYPGHPMAPNLAHRSGRRITRSMEEAVVSALDVVLCRRQRHGWPAACVKQKSFRGSSATSTMRRSIRRCGRMPLKASATMSAPLPPACIRKTRSAGPPMPCSGGAASPAPLIS